MFQYKSPGNVHSTGKGQQCEEGWINLTAKYKEIKFKPFQPSLTYFQTESVTAPPLPQYIVDSKEVSREILFLLKRNMFLDIMNLCRDTSILIESGCKHFTFLCCQHVVGCQKVKGLEAVHVKFQGLFVARRGQWSVAHGIVDLTPQEADGAAHLRHEEKWAKIMWPQLGQNPIFSCIRASSFYSIYVTLKMY